MVGDGVRIHMPHLTHAAFSGIKAHLSAIINLPVKAVNGILCILRIGVFNEGNASGQPCHVVHGDVDITACQSLHIFHQRVKGTDSNGHERRRAYLQGVEPAISSTGLSSTLDLPYATVLLGHMAQLIHPVSNDAALAFGIHTVAMRPCNLSSLGDVKDTVADLVVRLRFLMMRLQPVAPAHHGCG